MDKGAWFRVALEVIGGSGFGCEKEEVLCRETRVYKVNKCSKLLSNPQILGNNGGQGLYRAVWTPGTGQECNCPIQKENIPKVHYTPSLSYYTIELPQNSHAGRRKRTEAWCQPEGTLVPRKENPLSMTTVRSPCKRSQSQMAMMAWTTPWPGRLHYTYLSPSISCLAPKDALGRAGSIDLSVPIPNMGTQIGATCFSLLFNCPIEEGWLVWLLGAVRTKAWIACPVRGYLSH